MGSSVRALRSSTFHQGLTSPCRSSLISRHPASGLVLTPRYASTGPELDLNLSRQPVEGSGKLCFNRSVLLMGGTSGIGYAVAERLIKEGVGRILIPTRSEARGRETIDRLKLSTGLKDVPVTTLEVDIKSPSAMLNKALKQMQCDTFVASAGISQSRLITRTTAEQAQDIMAVNYLATTQLAREFLKLHVARSSSIATSKQLESSKDETPEPPKSFCFVALSSLLAVKDGRGAAAYAASKAALVAYTRALALEASLNRATDTTPFRANVVLPGYVQTPMLTDFTEDQVRGLEKRIPLGRLGRPEEVADAVIFLIANEYANNTVLNLDGGLSAT